MTTDEMRLRMSRDEVRAEVRAASVDWAARSLRAEGVPCDETLAARLIHIGDHYDVSVELLVTWIHDRYAGKEWTAERWARWCASYREAIKRLATEYARTEVGTEYARMEVPEPRSEPK